MWPLTYECDDQVQQPRDIINEGEGSYDVQKEEERVFEIVDHQSGCQDLNREEDERDGERGKKVSVCSFFGGDESNVVLKQEIQIHQQHLPQSVQRQLLAT